MRLDLDDNRTGAIVGAVIFLIAVAVLSVILIVHRFPGQPTDAVIVSNVTCPEVNDQGMSCEVLV